MCAALVWVSVCLSVWGSFFPTQPLAAPSLSLIFADRQEFPNFCWNKSLSISCLCHSSPTARRAHLWGCVCVFPPERGGIFLCRFLSVNSDHSLTELITIFQTSLFMHVTYSKCLISGYMLPVILLIKILCKCLVNCWCLMLIFTLDIKGFSYISGACLAGLCRYLPPGWYEGHFISADKSWLEFDIPEVWMDSAESLPIGGFVGLFSLNWVYEGLCGLALVLCQSQQVKDASSCRFHSLSFISCERDEELRQEFLLSARCV